MRYCSVQGPPQNTASAFGQLQHIYERHEAVNIETYSDKIPKFANKRSLFGGAVQMGTFVIEANRASYKKSSYGRFNALRRLRGRGN